MGEWQGGQRERGYIHIADSLCCIAEMNTPLSSSYTQAIIQNEVLEVQNGCSLGQKSLKNKHSEFPMISRPCPPSFLMYGQC